MVEKAHAEYSPGEEGLDTFIFIKDPDGSEDKRLRLRKIPSGYVISLAVTDSFGDSVRTSVVTSEEKEISFKVVRTFNRTEGPSSDIINTNSDVIREFLEAQYGEEGKYSGESKDEYVEKWTKAIQNNAIESAKKLIAQVADLISY
jgi:hypothetical protein